jgi:hypothetical protein
MEQILKDMPTWMSVPLIIILFGAVLLLIKGIATMTIKHIGERINSIATETLNQVREIVHQLKELSGEVKMLKIDNSASDCALDILLPRNGHSYMEYKQAEKDRLVKEYMNTQSIIEQQLK